jgi:hypothetical protein
MKQAACRLEKVNQQRSKFLKYINKIQKYYPRDKSFTDNFLGGPYK